MSGFTASLVVMLVLGVCPLKAQEPSSSRAREEVGTTPARRTYDPARRVPRYFGQIGLTPEQKEMIYKIRAGHQEQIDALERQIAEIQAKTLAECESVLTDTQKQLLAQRRRAVGQARRAPESTRPIKEPAKSPG